MLSFLKKYSHSKTTTTEYQHVDSLNKPELLEKKNMTPDHFKKKLGSLGSDPLHFSRKLLSLLAKEKEISQGVFFITDKKEGKSVLRFLSGYAFENPDTENLEIEFGEGFPGQVAKDGKLINISEVPDGYISIVSGLGKASPASIIIFPVINENEVLAVIELASFHKFTAEDENFFLEISASVADRLINLSMNK
jgi:putative methionine-R-sulfoxide reductase with GAF domain